MMAEPVSRHLRVTVTNMPPYAIVKTTPTFNFQGPMREILDLLSISLNFSYHIVTAKDPKIGNEAHGNGTWDGIIGMLVRNETDIGAGPFMINIERYDYLFYTPPVMTQDITILAGKPKLDHATAVRQFSYLSPLQYEVWICLLMFLLTVTIVYYFFDKMECRIQYRSDMNECFLIFRHLMNFFGGLINQGFEGKDSDIAAKRVLMVSFWFCAAMMMIWFNSCISANLVLSQDLEIIKDIQDLADLDHIRPIFVRGTAVIDFFKDAESGPFHTVWDNAEQYGIENCIFPVTEVYSNKILELVLKQEAAVVAGRVSSEFKAMHKCEPEQNGEFYFAENSFYPHYIALAGRKTLDVYWKHQITSVMFRMIETGIIEEMFDKQHRKLPICHHDTADTRFEPLSLETVNEAFYILFVGYGLSIIAFIGELMKNCKGTCSSHCRKSEGKKIRTEHLTSTDIKTRRKRTYSLSKDNTSAAAELYDLYYFIENDLKRFQNRQGIYY